MVSPAAMATIAYDPPTGQTVWTVYHQGMNAAARPLYGNDLVYINAGDGPNALLAVRPDGRGDVTRTHVQWRQGRLTPRRPSQLLIGKLYFMIGDEGVASCLDAMTGQVIWKTRVDGTYWASPLHAEGHIYFFSQEGDVAVIKAAPRFELVARSRLSDGFNASPAVAGQALILRTMSHVYRIERRDG